MKLIRKFIRLFWTPQLKIGDKIMIDGVWRKVIDQNDMMILLDNGNDGDGRRLYHRMFGK